MTLMVAGLTALLTFAFGVGLASVGRAAALDARVQMAADAAALAAVAESAPGGSSQPASAAYRFAAANGAWIASCICEPGSTSVQVTVVIGEASATARAVFDPGLLAPSLPAKTLPSKDL